MKWFKSKKEKKSVSSPITETDKGWIEENYDWLFKAWGYPASGSVQYVFDKLNFPLSHKSNEFDAHSLKVDICNLLSVDSDRILIDFKEDIRDLHNLPYGFEATPFESEVNLAPDSCQIVLANNLKKHPARLLHCMVLELTKVRFYQDKLEYRTGEDADHFIFLAATYMGFGAILFNNLLEQGKSEDAFWRETWNFSSIVPEEVMAYALALYMDITKLKDPEWIVALNAKQKALLKSALDYLGENPSSLIKPNETEASELHNQGYELGQQNKFEEAIEVTKKALLLSEDAILLSDLQNNVGYYQQRLGQYEMSIESLQLALGYDAANAYAFSNLAYGYVMMGRHDVAKPLIEAIFEINDDIGFAHRNTAVYQWKAGNLKLAEEHFQKGLDQETNTDLLELHYAQFLLEQERAEEAKKQLSVALGKGEPEAMAWAKETGLLTVV